jgi:hypothetical protein
MDESESVDRQLALPCWDLPARGIYCTWQLGSTMRALGTGTEFVHQQHFVSALSEEGSKSLPFVGSLNFRCYFRSQ